MRLISLTVNKNDSTSFYRANGVLADLKNQMQLEITSMNFEQLQNMSWANLCLFDVVFMQRPFQDVAVKMAEYCREMNLPVWMDFDDHLLEIPISNTRAYDTFAPDNIRKNIVRLVEIANVISVSTAALKTAFATLNKNIRVIPNAINTSLFNYRQQQKTNKTVLWRGSDTHQLDIFLYADPIFNATQKYSDWNFTWFGYYPWYIPPTPNSKYIKATDPVLYFKQLHGLAPRIMQVPLADSLFNRCKSNIAYLEGTFAGAVCLVPDWEEWQQPGAVKYTSIDDYNDKLELLLNDKVNARKRNSEAWEHIMQNLTLAKVNRQRVELLEQIMTC